MGARLDAGGVRGPGPDPVLGDLPERAAEASGPSQLAVLFLLSEGSGLSVDISAVTLFAQSRRLAEFAVRHRLPSTSPWRSMPTRGC